MYPAGACPEGARDMAGTVWEWCLNKYDRPDRTASRTDDLDPRVLRGGSWLNRQGGARCAYRFGSDPGSRSGNIGFRVLCSSPILER